MKKIQKQNSTQNKGALFLIFLGWIVYTISYLGKVNYSANITQIIDFYGITKAQAGIVPTFFFFAYGIGQVVNGLLCRKYNIKWVIFGSLIVSATINLTIATGADFSVVKWLWMVNGFTLSMLWPTLVRLLAEALPQENLGTSSVIMGTTVATGTLVIYGLSSIYAAFGSFKLSFYTAAFAMYAVSAVWLIFYNSTVRKSKLEKAKDETVCKVKTDPDAKAEQKNEERKIFYATICAMCFCAIGVNLTKDGLTTWVPSILKEEFSMSDSLSILLTLFLPVVAVFANANALSVHKKIPDYIMHCGVIFAAIGGFTGIIIGSLALKISVLMLLGMIIISFLASSLNSLITSIFPLFMRERINSGMCAGLLNGFCYLGSTISSYGLGVIADNYGWSAVFYTLLAVCVATCMVWGLYELYKHSISKKY